MGLDPKDPIEVSYEHPVGDDPTGKAHPELLKMHPSHGHDQTIVNGISRIGYMSGGRAARWVDEDMADVLTGKATDFIERHRDEPFFLYFATHDIHVPRVPHARFAGRSGLGPRGDVILQLDWAVGAILDTLDRLKLADKTLVLFTSDNGPVVDDGYRDQAVEKLGGHRPSGPLRGGKYSAFDGGTRVPMIVRWPGRVKPGVSDALVGQVDFLASFAALTGQALAREDAPDSLDVLGALLGDVPDRARRAGGAGGRPLADRRTVEAHLAARGPEGESRDEHRARQRPAAAALRPLGRPGGEAKRRRRAPGGGARPDGPARPDPPGRPLATLTDPSATGERASPAAARA